MSRLLLSLVVSIASAGCLAVELSLEKIISNKGGVDSELIVESKAEFEYDPSTGSLISKGTWSAQHPNLTPSAKIATNTALYTHVVEDLEIKPDLSFRFRSYQCIQDASINLSRRANICEGYLFGKNQLDDGGLVDDIVVSPPKSLTQYAVTLLDWQPPELTIMFSLIDTGKPARSRERSLTLVLSDSPR